MNCSAFAVARFTAFASAWAGLFPLAPNCKGGRKIGFSARARARAQPLDKVLGKSRRGYSEGLRPKSQANDPHVRGPSSFLVALWCCGGVEKPASARASVTFHPESVTARAGKTP